MNISERISEQVISLVALNVLRINDNVLKGFHARLGKPKEDGTRLVSYYFFYRVGGRNGRQVNYFIGNNQTIDAGLARRIAIQVDQHVKDGKDILKMKFEAEKEAVRFKDFWRYLGEEFILNKYKNGHEICRQFNQYILPQIGSIHLQKLNHRMISLRVIEPIILDKKVSIARTMVSYLKQLLLYAFKHDYISKMPILTFDALSIKNKPVTNKSVTTHLSGAQIKGVYYRANKAGSNSVYLFTLRLQILTGQSLATICRSYRQDIKGNKWLLRDRNGKLNGKAIPLEGPLKTLLKEGVKEYSLATSLYLIPGKGSRAKDDKSMDPKSLAKHQQKFINEVQGQSLSMTQLLLDIKNAMIQVGVSPLVVAYLFHTKVEEYMQLTADDPLIIEGLNTWYNG